MVSAKKDGPKTCNKCSAPLTAQNWKSYDQKHSQYICIPCRKEKDQKYYKSDPHYSKKQMDRYYARKNIVINSYGDICVFCGEDEYVKLTMDRVDDGSKHREQVSTSIYDFLYHNPVSEGYQVLCYNCNYSKNVRYKDKYYLRDRTKVLNAYGGKCEDCGITEFKFLTINRKNDDEAGQRRTYDYGTGARFYRWLIKNNYPANLGLRILCYNCNCSKLSIRGRHQ